MISNQFCFIENRHRGYENNIICRIAKKKLRLSYFGLIDRNKTTYFSFILSCQDPKISQLPPLFHIELIVVGLAIFPPYLSPAGPEFPPISKTCRT